MREQHIVHIPYFTTLDGMTSILTLNNNMTEMATAAVTLYNVRGQALVLPTIDLAPQLPSRFDLGQLVKNRDFSSGNVQIAFNGMSMGITSQVSVISPSQRLAFESTEDEAMDFSSSRLDGILWLPDAETQARLALTNTTNATVTVTATSARNGQERRDIALDPHETQLLPAEEFLQRDQDASTPASLLTLEHNGSPGALMVTGFAVNKETGFSCNFPFVDRSTAVSTHLAGAHVRMGLPNPKEGFPSGTRFSAPLILGSVGNQQTRATIALDYTVSSVPHRLQLGVVGLNPGQTSQLDLAQALAERGILGPLDDAGVDVNYTGSPGTVIGRLTSFDQSKDFAFEIPVKDPRGGMNRSEGSYPWRLDNGTTTVVHLKNTINAEVGAIVQVRYAGGNYNPERIKLAPFQTVAIDIRAARDGQERDVRGGMMPRDVESGQVVWYEQTVGSLIGRAEVFNFGEGIASSFSCGGNNCPLSFHSVSMSPSSAVLSFGDSSAPFTPQETDVDCQSNLYPPFSVTNGLTWSSTNTNVATVGSDGTITTVGVGTATILAGYSATVYECGNGCLTTNPNPQAQGNLTVKPKVTGSGPNTVPLDSSGQSGVDKSIQITATGSPSGGTYSWTKNNSNVTLTNTSSATVTVSSAQASTSRGDTTVTVTYTLNGQSATATQQITVLKPSSLSVRSSTPNSTGHTCDPSVNNPSCQTSGFTGNGTYTSYVRTIIYDVMDQFTPAQKITGFNMFISESYTTPTGQCAGPAVVIGSGLGQAISDCFYFCSETCRTGGSCNVSATQTLLVNGFTVATKSVTWTCSDASVQ
jgi:hypothetical protein